MWGIGLVLLSSLWTAGGNLCLRKNLDFGGSPGGYLVAYYLFSLLGTLAVAPFSTPFSPAMFITGGIVGALNICLMLLTAKALSIGPASLTFAFVCASSIVPSLLLPLVFGPPYGFILTAALMVGIICILLGLFWASKSKSEKASGSLKWLVFAICLLLIQGTILCLFQWRCLIMRDLPAHPLLFISCQPEEEAWFMPGMFISAFTLQLISYLATTRRFLTKPEAGFGLLGGLANGASTFFLLWATQVATALEKGILFPCSAIATILLCNLWGQWLYRERVNWWANALCSAGIIIGAFG
ncbi:MAG: hypothetical protein LLG04_07075 [Parachlamydia sp.]|nr:hypothetical protein [Parachlamydia sp.]